MTKEELAVKIVKAWSMQPSTAVKCWDFGVVMDNYKKAVDELNKIEEANYKEEYEQRVDCLLRRMEELETVNKEHQKINGELREEINGIREERDYLFNKLSIENKYLSQENQQLKDVVEKIREYVDALRPHWIGNDLVLRIIDGLSSILDKGE